MPAEEVMTFYARMLDHDYTSKTVFNKNFFGDWRKVSKFCNCLYKPVFHFKLSCCIVDHPQSRLRIQSKGQLQFIAVMQGCLRSRITIIVNFMIMCCCFRGFIIIFVAADCISLVLVPINYVVRNILPGQ